MNVLNNSYYSSKYKRDGSYTNGLRTKPASTREIEDFLMDFSMNSKRYSIEAKLSSYGNTLGRASSVSHNTIYRKDSSRSSSISYSINTMRKPSSSTQSPTASTAKPALPSTPAPLPPKPQKETAVVLYDITLDINPSVLVCNEGDGTNVFIR